MPGSKVTGPIQTTLHVSMTDHSLEAAAAKAAAAAWGDVETAFAAATDGNFERVERTVNIGDQGETSNPLNWTEFGEDRQKSIAGPAGTSTFPFGVVNDDSKPTQKALLAAKNGTTVWVAIVTISDGKALAESAEATVDVIKGSIASKSKVRGTTGPNQTTIELAVEAANVFHQAA